MAEFQLKERYYDYITVINKHMKRATRNHQKLENLTFPSTAQT